MENNSEDEINLNNYQVVRNEYSSRLIKPTVTFNNGMVYANDYCLKKMPETRYVQFMVSDKERGLIIKPGDEETPHSFLWCTKSNKPKHIIAKVLYIKIMILMNWKPNYKYKLIGEFLKKDDTSLFHFDLNSFFMFKQNNINNEVKIPNNLILPENWKEYFGIPFEVYKENLRIHNDNGYTVFRFCDNSGVFENSEE